MVTSNDTCTVLSDHIIYPLTSSSILIITSVSSKEPQPGFKWKDTNLSLTQPLFTLSGNFAWIRNLTGDVDAWTSDVSDTFWDSDGVLGDVLSGFGIVSARADTWCNGCCSGITSASRGSLELLVSFESPFLSICLLSVSFTPFALSIWYWSAQSRHSVSCGRSSMIIRSTTRHGLFLSIVVGISPLLAASINSFDFQVISVIYIGISVTVRTYLQCKFRCDQIYWIPYILCLWYEMSSECVIDLYQRWMTISDIKYRKKNSLSSLYKDAYHIFSNSLHKGWT